MNFESKRSRVLEVHREEASRLKSLWIANPNRPSQAEFGEQYGIGGQSAVANFLSGASPLSLKAALGFSKGLGVPVESFSTRLAAEAAAIASTVQPTNDLDFLDQPAFSRRADIAPSDNARKVPANNPKMKKFVVSIHDRQTNEQVGMVALEAESMAHAHDKGVRLIQHHQRQRDIDIEEFTTAVFEVYSLKPAHWD